MVIPKMQTVSFRGNVANSEAPVPTSVSPLSFISGSGKRLPCKLCREMIIIAAESSKRIRTKLLYCKSVARPEFLFIILILLFMPF